jgi:Putative prokaryotic signal transducing protein
MPDYVTIERADNEAMAELIRQRLEDGGIPCNVAPGNLAAVAGAGASYTVSVPADRADDAKLLLAG